MLHNFLESNSAELISSSVISTPPIAPESSVTGAKQNVTGIDSLPPSPLNDTW